MKARGALVCLMLLCAPARAETIPVCAAARESRSALRPGLDGWIFAKRDFQTKFTLKPRAEDSFKRLAGLLAARGQSLVLFVAPPRAMMAAEKIDPRDMPPDYAPAAARAAYLDFLARLESTGVQAAGVTKGPDFYSPRDTHWTRYGAARAAEAVAGKIKTLPAFEKVPRAAFKTYPTGTARKRLGVYEAALNRLCGAAFKAQGLPSAATERVEGGLLTDEAPRIALLGTSFSANEDRYGFQGALKTALSADLLDASLTGGGFGAAAARYFASAAYRAHPPRVIAWEFLGAHNPDSKTARAAFRQILPAARGDCGAKALASWSGTVPEGSSALLSLSSAPARSYAVLTLQEPTARRVTLRLSYADGSSEKAVLTRSARAPHEGVYFFETEKAGLTGLSLETDRPAARAEARVCPPVWE